MRIPEHVVPRFDHPVHRALKELDGSLELRFNTKLERFEVWNRHGMVQRVVRSEGTGFAEPGEWLIPQLKRLDARYVGAVAAVRNACEIIDKANLELAVKQEQAINKHIEEAVHETLPLMRRAILDDPIIDKPFKGGTS